MSSSDAPQRFPRWRVTVGEGRYRRWPLWSLGSGHTQVPGTPGQRKAPGQGAYVGRMVVRAWSVSWLRCLLDDPISQTRTRRLTVQIDSWHIPQRGWSGRLGPLPQLLAHRVRMPRKDHGQAVIDVELRWSVPLRDLVAAILPVLTPLQPMPAPVSVDVTAQQVLPRWLGTRRNVAMVLGELPDNPDIRPHDVVLTATGAAPPLPAPPADGPTQPPGDGADRPASTFYGTVVAAASTGAGPAVPAESGTTAVVAGAPTASLASVVVDLEHAGIVRSYGPFGPKAPQATLVFGIGPDADRWHIAGAEGEVLYQGRLGRAHPAAELRSALAEVAVLRCPSLPAHQPLAEAALLADLVLAGVLVHVPELPPACAAHLSDEVVDLITAPLPGERADLLEWEVCTVRQRRAVMRGHGSQLVLPRLAASAFPGLVQPPSVSVLLVTKRLEHVATVLSAIEAQTYPNLEIVLCMHGVELSPQLRARIAESTRPVETILLPAGHGFGEAIGETTARARGSLVTKFDDDDTYGPEHVWDLVLARHFSGGTLVGKSAEFVYLQTLNTTVRRNSGAPEAYVSVVAGGTMLISKGDLEEVGGWRPVPRSIDRGLIDRVRRAGGLVYRTHPLGYVYHRHSGGHTWDPGLEYFLRGVGMQWPGLPQHAEFGTAGPAEAARSDSSPDSSPRLPVAPPAVTITAPSEQHHRPSAAANQY